MTGDRLAREAAEWTLREWGQSARVVPLGDVRFRYHVRGRRVDGSRRNTGGSSSSSADEWVSAPLEQADGCAGMLVALVVSAVLWVLLLGARAVWVVLRLGSRRLRRRTATVVGGPRQLGVRFADAANQRADVWLAWSGERMALLHVRPKWCEPLWDGELPRVERSLLRWPDGSRVRLPKGTLGAANLSG
ncbi:hypothetical protein N8J89_10990 [Crossiella sp. CA-258035]|uniref:hypothetical protein n=1 Tax=Crossiella sp. CA-258035 TaxID=2981138 RepID=UPI0024BCB11C|nr:hypothetical protein [Crossiella sp. CA-258035]WHT21555.1 hypothetical protein N8J89_10990 [Crossiella sp. CA-258035]